ncbi:Phosphatidylglycerophosphate phosphatase 1, chloroplastic [Psilocybe cubensis]|uniref:HAD phosphatase n=2 Tax=Psilocybe cubensis TaxID=181762 RepID=A0A8H7Y818_PSICU|nr:Phosphatidylglycerophosphate phosphatase 1, chloroplastic [Psilocybe cubensis]KAH9485605.1 Phosphatidylglycerophosphate phosphatase 1, chloroplastic [Psilocybe cubensis]
MPLNIPALLVPFQLSIFPRLVIPALVVHDIRQVDFQALRRAGYRGAIFDKDNCLTLPHKDTLIPELQEAWKSCKETFGERNVLIVSNSAGTHLDAGGIQAESVSHHLGVPVLSHKAMKPAYSCITAIRGYFKSLPDPVEDNELIVVGDRVFTDLVLANRMRMQYQRRSSKTRPLPDASNENQESCPVPQGPLSIWTKGVWERESMLMRKMEYGLISLMEGLTVPPKEEFVNVGAFVKPFPVRKDAKPTGLLAFLKFMYKREI